MQLEIIDVPLVDVPPEVLELIEAKLKERELENAVFSLLDKYSIPGIKYSHLWRAEYETRFIINAQLGGGYD